MATVFSNGPKLGWIVLVIALVVLLGIALRKWWYELEQIEKLSSEINPRWKQLKNIKHQR